MRNILDKINLIDRIYSEKKWQETSELLVLLNGDTEHAFFIEKLIYQFEPSWFVFAYENKVLSFDEIPSAIAMSDDNGNVSRGFRNWSGSYVIVEAAKKATAFPELLVPLMSIIDAFIDLAEKERKDLNRNFTVDYHICRCIFLIPIEKVTNRHLQFIKDFGLTRNRSTLSRDFTGPFFVKALNYDSKLTFELLEIFFTPIDENKDYRATSRVEGYALAQFVKSEAPLLYEKFDDDAVNWAIDKLAKISRNKPFSFSKLDLPSLEPDRQNYDESGFNFSLTRLVIQLLAQLDVPALSERLKTLLNRSEAIFKRICYLFMDKEYDNLSSLFWKQKNPLNDPECKLEVYRLISRNCEKFDIDQVKTMLGWIDDLEVIKTDGQSEEDLMKYQAYVKLEWHMAVESIHYKFHDLLIAPFNTLQEITAGVKPAHPGYDSYATTRFGGDYSQKSRILNKPVVTVLNVLANEKKWDGYNTYGLQQDLRDYVIGSLGLVMEELSKFLSIPLHFIYSFFDAFRTLAEKGTSFGVEQILTFLNQFLQNRDDLWDESEHDRDISAAVGMIAWFLNTLVNNNEYRLELSDTKSIIQLLITMDKRFRGKSVSIGSEPFSDVMNSTRGKIYEGMFNCSLREVRQLNNYKIFWDADVESFFTKKLHSNEGGPEFYWSLGFHIPQISYLNIEWIRSNKERLYEYQEDRYDFPVFYGYLLFSRQLYTNLFDLFIQFYFDQVAILTEDNTITRKFLEHIWVAYAIKLDKGNKLIKKVLQLKDAKQFNFLIDRINIEDQLRDEQQVKYLWTEFVRISEESNDPALMKIIAKTVNFIDLINTINGEILDLFIRTVHSSADTFNTYRLMNSIEKRIDSGDYFGAAQILLALLEHAKKETYFDEPKVREFTEVLYKHGYANQADQIAINSVYRNYFSLVHIYNQYHH